MKDYKIKFDEELVVALDEDGNLVGFFNNLKDVEDCEFKFQIDKILVYQVKEKFKLFMKMEALVDE